MDDNQAAAIPLHSRWPIFLVAGLFFARLITLLAAPIEALRNYGDLIHYYLIYQLPGWPFLNYWVEYPPIFPWIAAVLHRLAGGQEHVFYYLMAFLMLLADAGSLYLFTRLVGRLFPTESGLARALAYLLVMAAVPYSWLYFEPLVVFALLLGLTLILEGKIFRGGAALGAGVALKFFPGLGLLAAWQRYSWRKLIGLAALSVLPVILLYAVFWLVSPVYTGASLHLQTGRGSWESVWALIDGNVRTGMLGPAEERVDPTKAVPPPANPAVVPPLASLVVFGGVGLWGLSRFKLRGPNLAARDRQSIALVGFAWSLLMLWSPGWSPQWVLYLIPLILLALPDRQAYLLVIALTLVNLLEWPVLLSRGYFWALWVTIVIRTLLLLILAAGFFEAMNDSRQPGKTARDGMV